MQTERRIRALLWRHPNSSIIPQRSLCSINPHLVLEKSRFGFFQMIKLHCCKHFACIHAKYTVFAAYAAYYFAAEEIYNIGIKEEQKCELD